MTTQNEVMEAFLAFRNEPSSASNLQIVLKDGSDSDAYLVSGRQHVLAEREGLDSMQYWRGYPAYSYDETLTRGWVRRQQNKFRRLIRRSDRYGEHNRIGGYATPPPLSEQDDASL